jgi:ParB family chromosome partitioning protein
VEFHEVAGLFPMMAEDEFASLVEDVQENGLREPIWTHQGKIIDGRNRFLACQQARVSPRFREWDGSGSLVQFVVSLNLKRRHLSSSQKAMVAVEMLPMLEKEREERRKQFATNRPRSEVGNFEPVVPILAPLGKSRDEAAKAVGVSHGYVSDAKRIADKAPELVQPVLSGEIKMPEAKRIAELPPEERQEAIQKPHVAHNGGNNEWYTPQEYIDAARVVLRQIDLDPATSATANEVVRAARFYTAEDDGLSQEWSGRVWMNPPYAQPLIWQFCDKLAASVLAGSVTEAIVLVNNGTETAWFQRLAETSTAICFPKGRVKFWSPDKIATPLQGQAFFYMGPHPDTFTAEFSRFGLVVRV